MFFKHKTQNNAFNHIEKKLQALEYLLSQKNSQIDSIRQDTSQLNSIHQSLQQLQSDVHRHDMAIEDLLDEWDDKKSDESSIQEQFHEFKQTEKLLLELFEAYQEQFWSLKHYADAKDANWANQISLMEETLERFRRLCGISVIQEYGIQVDYNLHDVVKVIDTADPGLNQTVADIYRCGYIYKGKVKKKAQIAAYRTDNTQ